MTEDAAGGRENLIDLGKASLGLSLVPAGLYVPLLLMSLYFWQYPQSVPDSPGLALYILLAPFAILGLPLPVALLALWSLLRERRDRLYAAGAILSCATVLFLAGVITPWVVGMPEQFVRMALFPEPLDPTPEPIQWVRGQEYELTSTWPASPLGGL
ncbi:MAG: hypothetical protein ACRDTR_06400 [Rubrobacter sp.]